MTFRTNKRHRAQESGKSARNALKLASRLQHFLNTGKSSKQDLKAIDAQFSQRGLEQGEEILRLLERLKERFPKTKGRESIEETCEAWTKWLDSFDSKGFGYFDLRLEKSATMTALLESAIDADTDFFRMLSAFNVSLANSVTKSSYEVPDSIEIAQNAHEILEAYDVRQRVLSKLLEIRRS